MCVVPLKEKFSIITTWKQEYTVNASSFAKRIVCLAMAGYNIVIAIDATLDFGALAISWRCHLEAWPVPFDTRLININATIVLHKNI